MVKLSDICTRQENGIGILSKIAIDDVAKTLQVLRDPKANGNDRFGLACTLCFYGYSEIEAFGIIKDLNKWEKFDPNITKQKIRKAYDYKKHKLECAGNHIFTSIFPNKPAPSYSFDPKQLYTDFVTNYMIPFEPVPLGIKEAAIYHWFKGRHPIPKGDGKKPGIPWKEFQERKPTLDEILSWDWSRGLILLGTDQHCYLDIDPDGIQYINRLDFNGAFYENTPRGGFHVYGVGYAQTNKKLRGNIELIAKGAYIVAFPSPGYVIGQAI